MSKHITTRHNETNVEPILTRIVEEDKVPWYRKPNLRYLYFMLVPTCMGIEITSGFDSQLINALQIVPSWVEYFDDPQGPYQGFIGASYSLGAVLSLPFVPIVNRKFGRRWGIFGGSCVMMAGAIIQGCAQHAAMYIIARMILGFGIPTCIVAGSSLIGELAYPKERPFLTSFFNVSYFFGQITAAGICRGTNQIVGNMGWRIPSWLQIAPSLLQVGLIFFVPESPRWLVSNDRVDEAYDILVQYHAEGDRDSEFVRAEMAQITETIKIEYEASKETWFDLLRTAGMRRRALVTMFLGLFTQWSGNTLISYYLGDLLLMIGYTNSTTRQNINLVNSCWSLVAAVAVALLVRSVRRRVMYLICTCCLLTVYVSWTISMRYASEEPRTNAAAWSTLIWIFLYAPAYNIGYNVLTYTYLVELWPYALRSRGISMFQLFGRLATFFTTFVNPIGIDSVGWRYLIMYICWLAFEIVFVFFFFPETSGKTLEELSLIFEGDEAAQRARKAVEKALAEGHTEHKEAGATVVEKTA